MKPFATINHNTDESKRVTLYDNDGIVWASSETDGEEPYNTSVETERAPSAWGGDEWDYRSAIYPTPWRVEYQKRFPSWHDQSLPSIVDANGEFVCGMVQHANHPGTYDAIAVETAKRIVEAVNREDYLS